MTRIQVVLCVAAVLSLTFASAAQAELWKIRDGDTDSFGRSVAVAGDVAWIGGLFKALAYHRIDDEWVQVLDFPWPVVGSFGEDVATDGETAVVGSQESGPIQVGQAYVFERHGDSWSLAQTLHPAVTTEDARFGACAAVSGSTLMVGAPADDTLADFAGTVHVFERLHGTWTETAQLFPSVVQSALQFGGALALQGDRVVVGAHGYDGETGNLGAAFVFERRDGTWVETAQLVSPTTGSDNAGRDVALDGDLALVGCDFCDTVADDAGSVLVFERTDDGWVQTDELVASDGAAGEIFGTSVATSQGRILVGKPHDNGPTGQDVQTAYLFEREGEAWVESPFHPSDQLTSANYGRDVALDGDTALIGTPGDQDSVPGGEGGSVYVLDMDAKTVWVSLGQGLAGAGGVPALVVQGNLFAGSTLTAALTGAAPFAPVGLVFGLDVLNAPFKGGTLVPDPLFIAYVVTGPSGVVMALPTLPKTLPPELQLVAQAWIVDTGGPKGFAASNATAGSVE